MRSENSHPPRWHKTGNHREMSQVKTPKDRRGEFVRGQEQCRFMLYMEDIDICMMPIHHKKIQLMLGW